ncbi:Crp/Fnr family transcriptional regulator [soil metagenome]
MKFAPRDGSAGRTLAVTVPPLKRLVMSSSSFNSTPFSQNTRGSGSTPVRTTSQLGRTPQAAPRSVNSSTKAVSFIAGQEVFDPNRGHGLVYIVRTGCVRLYKPLPDGRSINLGILGPNTVFTQEDTTTGIASGAVAEAMIDSTISVVPVDELANVIASSPELAAAMVTGMTRRLTEVQTLVEHLLVRDTSVRLAVTLMQLAQRFGRPAAGGMTAITIPLTHQSLANMIGSNRVTVTRKLLELQEAGIVRSLGRNAISVEIDGLRNFAQSATQPR